MIFKKGVKQFFIQQYNTLLKKLHGNNDKINSNVLWYWCFGP